MLKKNLFFKYIFYQKALKKGKKNYFLLDFFRGLKGAYPLKKQKLSRKLKVSFLYKSFNLFNNFDLNLKKSYNFDYFFKDLNVYFFKNFKVFKKIIKKNIFLVTFLEHKDFFFFSLKNIWLIQFFLNLKKAYLFSFSLNFFNLFKFNYLNNYYYFLKNNLMTSSLIIVYEHFKYKLSIKFKSLNLAFYLLKLYNFFFFCFIYKVYYKNKVILYYNKYNSFKDIKILYMNRSFRKFNKFLNNFKNFKINLKNNMYNKKKIKFFFINLIKTFNYNNLNINNKLCLSLGSKKLKFKYANTFFLDGKKKVNSKKVILKFNFFINFLYKLYSNQCLNNFNKFNIVLVYYFNFYNFIIKIFIKLLYNFKFILLNKISSKVLKRLVWVKIYLIFLYYKNILLNNLIIKKKKKKTKLLNFIKLSFSKILKTNQNLVDKKFNLFISRLPLWRKKIVNDKFNFFLKNLKLKLNLVKKIKYYKKEKSSNFINLGVYKLKKILSRLNLKMNKMKGFKKKKILKMRKLVKFIKSNKLKPLKVLKFLGLKLKKKKKFVRKPYC